MHVRLLMTVVAFLVFSSTSRGADASRSANGLSITVMGKSTGQPDTMKITLSSSGTAGTASDALQQCTQKTESAVKAVQELGIDDMDVEVNMCQFSSPVAAASFMMQQVPSAPSGTMATQSIIVKVANIRTKDKGALAAIVVRVLDAANKAGVGISQTNMQAAMQGLANNPVEYTLTDASELRASALEDATQKMASRKALFKKSGMNIGKLLSINDSTITAAGMNVWQQYLDANNASREDGSVSSTDPEKVTVMQKLTMVYEIAGE